MRRRSRSRRVARCGALGSRRRCAKRFDSRMSTTTPEARFRSRSATSTALRASPRSRVERRTQARRRVLFGGVGPQRARDHEPGHRSIAECEEREESLRTARELRAPCRRRGIGSCRVPRGSCRLPAPRTKVLVDISILLVMMSLLWRSRRAPVSASGRPKWKPWPNSQPSARRAKAWRHLHALGDDRDVERVAESDDGAHDCGAGASEPRPATKLMSILSSSTGSAATLASDE